MSLKVDSSHEKMNLSGVRLKSKPDIKRTIGAITLAISILSPSAVRAFDETHEDIPLESESITETFSQDDLSEGASDVSKDYLRWEARNRDVRKNKDNFEQSRNEKISRNEMVDLGGIAFGLEFDDGRAVSSDSLSYEDLLHVTKATIVITDNYDYDFLNYMPNLEELNIFDNSTGEKLANIQGSVFTKNIKISVTGQGGVSFSKERYGFIGDIEQIDSLTIGAEDMAINIDSEFLHSLKQIKNLSLGLGIMTNLQNVDFTNLDSLELIASPYDVAMYFSNEDLSKLEAAGVKLIIPNRQQVESINDRIDSIVRDFNLPSNATDQEKLNAILVYVLENLTYDQEISQMVESGNLDLNSNSMIRNRFYGEGEMTAVFENSTQICGNYTALVYRLCKAVGLKSFNLKGKNHVWNAVKVGDYYYYVDATWLDGETVEIENRVEEENEQGNSITISFSSVDPIEFLKSNDQEGLEKFRWYMVDPTEVASVDDAEKTHDLDYTPAGFEIVAVPDGLVAEGDSVEQQNNAPDISESKFKINLNGKTYIIAGAAFAGIMSALGIGIVASRKKRNRRQQTMGNKPPGYNSGPPSYGYAPKPPSYDSTARGFGHTPSQPPGNGLFGPYNDDPFSNSRGFGK